MSWLPAQTDSLSPQALRAEAGARFPALFESLLARTGCRVVDVERSLGLGRAKLYEYLDGNRAFQLAWLPLLPPVLERAILEERATALGFVLRHAGAEDAAPTLHELVARTTAVMATAAAGEADGVVTREEAAKELAEIDQLERVLAARKALLGRVAHGPAVRHASAAAWSRAK